MALFFAIQCIYGFILFAIYAIVSYRVRKCRKKFKPLFLNLYFLLTALSFTSYLLNYFCFRLPPLFNMSSSLSSFFVDFPCPRFLHILYFLCYYMFYAQNIMHLVMSINRLKVVVMPFDNNTLWDEYSLISVSIVLIPPLFFTLGIFTLPYPQFQYNQYSDGFYLTIDDPRVKSYILCLIIFECLITVSSLMVNLYALFLLSKRSKMEKHSRDKMISCTLSFSIQLLTTGVAVSIYYFERNSRQMSIALFVIPIISDLLCLGIPYIILGFTPRIRTILLDLLSFKKDEPTERSLLREANGTHSTKDRSNSTIPVNL